MNEPHDLGPHMDPAAYLIHYHLIQNVTCIKDQIIGPGIITIDLTFRNYSFFSFPSVFREEPSKL